MDDLLDQLDLLTLPPGRNVETDTLHRLLQAMWRLNREHYKKEVWPRLRRLHRAFAPLANPRETPLANAELYPPDLRRRLLIPLHPDPSHPVNRRRWDTFFTSPQLRLFSSFELRGNPEVARQFAQSPHTDHAREVVLCEANEARVAWMSAAHLPALTDLTVRAVPPHPSPSTLAALLRATPPRSALILSNVTLRAEVFDALRGRTERLRTLILQRTTLDLDAAHTFATLDLPALARLSVEGAVADEHIAALLANPTLSNLSALDLRDTYAGPETALTIAMTPHLHALHDLELTGNALTPEALRALLARPALHTLDLSCCALDTLRPTHTLPPARCSLRDLDLSGNALGESGVRALTGMATFPHLHTLHLGFCSLDDGSVAALLDGLPTTQTPLTELRLDENAITARGAHLLATSPHIRTLTELSLYDNPIGDEGAHALAALDPAHTLTHLGLANCRITAEGASALASAPQLRREGLTLDLEHNPIPLHIVEQLARTFPGDLMYGGDPIAR